MFKLNLKIALRNLWKNKTSSFINIIGLAIGLAACLMLLLYITYELNFDRQSKQADRVYKVMTNIEVEGGKISMTFDGTVPALAPTIQGEIPEIEAISRIDYGKKKLIANGEKSFKIDSKFAEPSIFKIYDYKFIVGDPKTALANVNSVVLTESTAMLLFGRTDILNQTVRFQDKSDLMVSAVIKDMPDNSSNKFGFLMPWSYFESINPSVKNLSWNDFSYLTMILLAPHANVDLVNKKIKDVVNRSVKDAGNPYFIYPLSKLHLYGKFEEGKSVGGDIEQIWLFTGLAFGILLIACINFMNMATAKAEKRAKEVGIKKTMGANRSSLIVQFLAESMVLTVLAVIVAIAILEICLPTFNHMLNIKLNLSYFDGASFLGILAIVLVTGLIAGSYPAFYLSSFHPVQTLKRSIHTNKFLNINVRQILVVGQFCFAIILIISTLVIYRQIQYVKNKPVGFDINALVEMPQEGALKTKYDLLRNNLLKSGAVTSMFQSSVSLSHHGSNFMDIKWEGMTEQENKVMFNKVATTFDFIKTNGIKLKEGRDFSMQYASDTTNGVLISTSAAKVMGYSQPLGKSLTMFGSKCMIIGVFDDYVWDSPYKSNNPMVVFYNKQQTGTITMRLNRNNSLQQNIATITKITKELNPAYPVELNFLNNLYAEKYNKEKTLGILSNLFGALAIFVSCLGLFGLVSYSAAQRTKEFGVRKVLGASIGNLMQLLSLSFVKMILVAVLIAVPISYYAMNKWLANFEFRTEISWWIIPLATIATLAMALITISFQAYKSAKANPVDALKYE